MNGYKLIALFGAITLLIFCAQFDVGLAAVSLLGLGMAVTEAQLIERGPNDRTGGPVAASTILYAGTMCFIDAATGGLTGTTNAGANLFAGVVPETYDNSGGALGDIQGDRWIRGQHTFYGTGFDAADVGKPAYAVDNFTVSTTAAGNSECGVITRVVSATEVVVDISPAHN